MAHATRGSCFRLVDICPDCGHEHYHRVDGKFIKALNDPAWIEPLDHGARGVVENGD